MSKSSENINPSSKIKARAAIENLKELPSIPAVVVQALNLIDDPNANINRLAEIISTDISITTQILKLVNSAYYGFPSQITTINKALALLGFNKVKGLIMGVAIKPMMLSDHGKMLWHHSLRCAVAARYLAKNLRYRDPEEAFVFGLLHDICKTVLQIQNIDAYREIQKLVSIGADVLDAERTFYGFAHTDAGKALVEKWNLPLIIGITVAHHHNPLKSEEITSASIVYVADRITQDRLKYPVFKQEIIDAFDYEVPDPEGMREEIIRISQPIIDAFS